MWGVKRRFGCFGIIILLSCRVWFLLWIVVILVGFLKFVRSFRSCCMSLSLKRWSCWCMLINKMCVVVWVLLILLICWIFFLWKIVNGIFKGVVWVLVRVFMRVLIGLLMFWNFFKDFYFGGFFLFGIF